MHPKQLRFARQKLPFVVETVDSVVLDVDAAAVGKYFGGIVRPTLTQRVLCNLRATPMLHEMTRAAGARLEWVWVGAPPPRRSRCTGAVTNKLQAKKEGSKHEYTSILFSMSCSH
jgi:hypothetical protein